LLLDPTRAQPPRRLERFSALTRQAPGSRFATQVLAANVDTLLIVTACNQEFNIERIERYLALAAEAQIRPVLVLTKADLAPGNDPAPAPGNAPSNAPGQGPQIFIEQARTLGEHLQIECLNARDPDQLEPIRKLCGPGQTVAALGSSGVGKSTLINGLTGLSGEAGQPVGEVRGDDNKGKHTTSSRSLHPLPAGGVLVDLPGIRELQLTGAVDGIDDTFAEITALIHDCRFTNCSHTNEPGCAIAAALAAGKLNKRRWENYRKLQGEQKVYGQAKADRTKRDGQRSTSKKTQRRLDKEDQH
jgi:ribosome biogenesis GTPase / thiamine phosphate phosphatase